MKEKKSWWGSIAGPEGPGRDGGESVRAGVRQGSRVKPIAEAPGVESGGGDGREERNMVGSKDTAGHLVLAVPPALRRRGSRVIQAVR